MVAVDCCDILIFAGKMADLSIVMTGLDLSTQNIKK